MILDSSARHKHGDVVHGSQRWVLVHEAAEVTTFQEYDGNAASVKAAKEFTQGSFSVQAGNS